MEALAGILAGSSASSVPWRCSSGVVEHDACWVLGGRGQGCSEVCGGSALVDADAFRQFGSSTRVVTSLSLHFGLSPAHRTSAFDVPCVSAADDHPAYGTAAFLYFADVDLWDCFPGESVFSIAPIFQAGCACHAPPSPPPSPPPQPPYHTMWFEAWCVAPRGMLPGLDSSCAGTAAGLLCVLLGIGLAGFCAAAAAAGQQEELAASPGVTGRASRSPYRNSPYRMQRRSWLRRSCDWLTTDCWPVNWVADCYHGRWRCCRGGARRVHESFDFARTPTGAFLSTAGRAPGSSSSQWGGDTDVRAVFARADRNLSGKLDYRERAPPYSLPAKPCPHTPSHTYRHPPAPLARLYPVRAHAAAQCARRFMSWVMRWTSGRWCAPCTATTATATGCLS